MKKYFLSLIVLALTAGITFAQSDKMIDVTKSSVNWEGKKVTGAHNGTINISEGKLSFANGRLSGGSFTIDMTSIANADLGDKMKGRLEGHLKSDDFFGVETYPTAQLVITNVGPGDGGYSVTGDLTIKGITKPVTFMTKMTDTGATAAITVDRTLYDVKYGSGKFFDNLGDKMINDNFELEVNLAF